MVTRGRSVTAAVLGGLLAAAASGCAEEANAVALDRATGAVLADAADRLADALAADDPCRALLEAEALRDRAARALDDGDAPESVVTETVRVVDATTSGLSCEPAEDVDADGEDADDAGASDDDADGSDDGDGEDEGPDTDGTDATSGESDSADAPSGGSGDPPATDDGGEGGEGDPPGNARGHDDGGGPPADRGKARGRG